MTCPASFAGLVRWLVVISVVISGSQRSFTDEMGLESGMSGILHQRDVIHPEQGHRCRQAFFGRQVEQNMFGSRHGQPDVLGYLMLQLPPVSYTHLRAH